MNIRLLLSIICMSLLPFTSNAQEAEAELTPEQQQYIEWADNLWSSIPQITGQVELPNNVATLNVPDTFYYLNASDSKKVLEEIWGNPPSQSAGILGMLFPANTTPFEAASWGVTIEYLEDGYVEDNDANTIDYDELLSQMQEETQLASEQRVEQGYEPISLLGWAAAPYYDETSNKLHWAKELQFGDSQQHTLNYNIRILGRKGILVLNFIAGMEQLDEVNQNLQQVLNIAEFNDGSKYEDFDPEIDEYAAYGIGALVAGKMATKAGIFAAALIFLKKFGVFILLGLGAIGRKFFTGKKKDSE